LVAIGRELVDERVPRPAVEKISRWVLREGLTSVLFAPALALGRMFRGVLPELLKRKLPPLPQPRAALRHTGVHARKVLLLAGCVQPAMLPNINNATARVLDAAGLETGLVPVLEGKMNAAATQRLALHVPCTLQHGQRLRGGLDAQLAALGFEVKTALAESHLCCGSAGTYSVLQPVLATQLRDRKLKQLAARNPDCIVSANVGCILHLQSGTAVPVKHWIEVVDEALYPS
jgi:Fe-S oxidoreductase